MVSKAKQYINSKTNSILKYNSKRNNRDIVATIVYNELTDLLEYSNMSDITTPIDNEIIQGCINTVNTNLYSDKPLKLEKYCEKCQDPCCCCEHNNSFPDCFILGLELEDGTPFLYESDKKGIILLEMQRETECDGKLVCDCGLYDNVLGPLKFEDDSTIQLQCGLDILLEGDYNNGCDYNKSCSCGCTNKYCSIL